MRVKALITLLASLGLLFFMLPAAHADVTLTLVSAPYGIYDPYQFMITAGGVIPTSPYSGPFVSLNCDDYNDHITAGESWQAIVVSGGSETDLDTTLMGSKLADEEADEIAYDMLGYLLLHHSAGDHVDFSDAIWQVFSEGPQDSNSDYTAAKAAVALDGGSDYDTFRQQLTIYTPDLSNHTGWTEGTPQEFIVLTPDGGVTLMLLGGVLVGLETLRRRFRV